MIERAEKLRLKKEQKKKLAVSAPRRSDRELFSMSLQVHQKDVIVLSCSNSNDAS